ncbi:MAG TPA: 50S ribosomal protein L21 [Patescibacteria group bacterium]|nr:50S ribosomal protein L21 [Patescibacteria group bacterium]
MSKFDHAVVKTGGKQYLVKKGDTLNVEKLDKEKGKKIKLDTLLLFDKKAGDIKTGKPLLKTKIEAKILEHGKGKKVKVFKYKPKTRQRKKKGARQPFTKIEILEI